VGLEEARCLVLGVESHDERAQIKRDEFCARYLSRRPEEIFVGRFGWASSEATGRNFAGSFSGFLWLMCDADALVFC